LDLQEWFIDRASPPLFVPVYEHERRLHIVTPGDVRSRSGGDDTGEGEGEGREGDGELHCGRRGGRVGVGVGKKGWEVIRGELVRIDVEKKNGNDSGRTPLCSAPG